MMYLVEVYAYVCAGKAKEIKIMKNSSKKICVRILAILIGLALISGIVLSIANAEQDPAVDMADESVIAEAPAEAGTF